MGVAEPLFTETWRGVVLRCRVLLGLGEVTVTYFENDWIYSDFIASKFQFKYYGFAWVRVWQGGGMYLHFVALGIAALCVTLGAAYRIAALATFLLFTCCSCSIRRTI